MPLFSQSSGSRTFGPGTETLPDRSVEGVVTSPGSGLLARFRRLGSPGPSAAAGVPARSVPTAAEEFAPVLAMLGPTLAQVERIRAATVAEVAGLLASAATDEEAILRQAQVDASSQCAAAAARVRAEASQLMSALLDDARAHAVQLRSLGDGALPGLVAQTHERLIMALRPPGTGTGRRQ
jgi:hypothetical protein